ncbi:MAG: hypothetical protein ABIK92_07815 [Pseudomonadota bacterium]
MEIIFEIVIQCIVEFVPVLFEILVGTFGEVLLQILGEGLFEFGFRGLVESFNRNKQRNPFLAAIGYLLWGAIIGGLSLFLFRHSLIHQKSFRIMSLVFTPILAGISMSVIGALRKKRGQDLIRIDSFFYGYLFALGMAIVRYYYAN